MTRRLIPLGLILLLSLSFVVARPSADEGMWTFDNPPRKQWKERYSFEPSDEWLERVRLASTRLNDGGSGGFVSASGLLITNQHVAAGQLQKLSTPGKNYTRDGFYAPTREAELKCPDLEVNVLTSYEDVTARVQGAAASGAADQQAADQRRGAIAEIERASRPKRGFRSGLSLRELRSSGYPERWSVCRSCRSASHARCGAKEYRAQGVLPASAIWRPERQVLLAHGWA